MFVAIDMRDLQFRMESPLNLRADLAFQIAAADFPSDECGNQLEWMIVQKPSWVGHTRDRRWIGYRTAFRQIQVKA